MRRSFDLSKRKTIAPTGIPKLSVNGPYKPGRKYAAPSNKKPIGWNDTCPVVQFRWNCINPNKMQMIQSQRRRTRDRMQTITAAMIKIGTKMHAAKNR